LDGFSFSLPIFLIHSKIITSTKDFPDFVHRFSQHLRKTLPTKWGLISIAVLKFIGYGRNKRLSPHPSLKILIIREYHEKTGFVVGFKPAGGIRYKFFFILEKIQFV